MSWIKSIKVKGEKVLAFVMEPNDERQMKSNTPIFLDVLKLLVMAYLIIIPIGFLLYFLDESNVISLPDHKLEEFFSNKSIGMILFFSVVLAPFIEEVIFRGFITLRRCYPILLIVHMVGTNRRSRSMVLRKVRRIWNDVFPFVAWLSVLTFGFIHSTNFVGGIPTWMIPLVTLPQIVLGIFLTYVRVRYGLLWSMLLHGMGNLLATLMALPELLKDM